MWNVTTTNMCILHIMYFIATSIITLFLNKTSNKLGYYFYSLNVLKCETQNFIYKILVYILSDKYNDENLFVADF